MQELNLADWLEGILKWTQVKDEIECDSEKAEQMLMLLSKSFNSPPKSHHITIFQGRICSALSAMKCIPIGGGVLKRPKDCYFEDVPQLQVSMNIIKFSSESRRSRANENMLKAAGVHAHLPLDQIFANIGSLKWDHSSLIKYLVRVKDELSRTDMDKLRSTTDLFPDQESSGFYKLSDLYADTVNPEIVRILKLKILKWNPSAPREGSEIGEFLTDLGFNYNVPWRVLLKGVGAADSVDRALLFKYFFENYSYYTDYNGSKVDFPFVTVYSTDGKDTNIFLPSQVFLDEPLDHLGFYLIHPELKKYAQLLGIKERPSTNLITAQIIKTKLAVEKAQIVFAYCARISNEFSKEDWRIFRQHQFIPCLDDTTKISYKSHDQVFLPSSSANVFSSLFDQVDFGVQANSFLRSVGVVDEPRAENLISLLLKDPIKVFSQLKANKYTELIERIAQQWEMICSKHSTLARSFASSKSFIGHIRAERKDKNDSKDPIDQDNQDDKIQYSLYGIDGVFLIDDVISHQLFNLPTCSSNLEQFYLKLGSRWVSSVIRSEWKWTGEVRAEGPLIGSVKKILSERQNLIVASLDGNESGSGESKIVKGGRKRLEAAKIFQVDSIEIVRTCTVLKQTDSQASCAFTDSATAHPSIYLSKNAESQFDYFDLAAVIVGLLCDKKGRLQDSLLVASLLTTPLSSLRAKGFQVDSHIQKATEIVLPKPEPVKQILPDRERDTKPDQAITNRFDAPITNRFDKPPTVLDTPQTPQHQTPQALIPPVQTPQTLLANESQSTIDSKKSTSRPWTESLIGFFSGNSGSKKKNETLTGGKAGEARNEESIRKALDRGIQSLKPHKSGDFEARQPAVSNEPAPENAQVRKELGSYCQVLSSLRFVGKMGNVDIYAGDSLTPEMAGDLFSTHKNALLSFYGLIVDQLAYSVFKVSPTTCSIHLYFDPESSTIAFNRAHSLFFNFAYFLANQHFSILQDSVNAREVQQCKSFWFMTFCHELAHNFVHEHDAQHEFYMSSFAETFLPDFISSVL